jgi:YidC/Oxa1 family membrane protein insertase
VKQTGRGSVPAGSLSVEGPSDLGHEEFTGTNSRASGFRCATFANEKMDTEKPKRNQEGKDVPAPVTWAALADQFYVSAILPDASSGSASVRVLRDHHPQATSDDGKTVTTDTQLWVARPQLSFPSPALSAGEGFQRHFILYLGPQEVEQLKAMGSRLEKVLDLGMFDFISYYLLLILKWFFSWCHNWGVAIVLLSVLVKAVLWWPNHISFKHMSLNQKKMQAMQPKMDAIKKKYANDKAKQNEETMKLYQEANINLTSGCLPMLLQIPIFIALYSALSHSIELRGAPFALWIQDLSLRDPWYILPLLMGGSMFLQQRLSMQSNPASGSAGQQKFMMWFFPVFLTFMSFQWPAGLLVYWVVTNILSMWQQKMVNKSIKGF